MAVQQVRTCDWCQGVDDVEIVRVGYGKKAWEADLCQGCYQEFFTELEGLSRKPTKRAIGTGHRMKKTTIAATNL